MNLDLGTLTAILAVRDNISSGIKPALASLRGFTDQVRQSSQQARDAQGRFNSMGQSAVSLGGMLRGAATAAIGLGSALLAIGGARALFGLVTNAVVGMNATLETATLQFTTLMGSADRARDHVRDLFEIAKKTPFETGPIIEASRLLQTFGGDALNTKANILLLGDAAAATGAPIDQLGFWVGRLYSMLQGGKPFGEAAMRLQELAVLSPQVRDAMEAMQKQGKSADEIFAVLTTDLEKFGGAMKDQAGTWAGVTSTFKDTVNILLADTFRPFFEIVRDGLALINDALGSDGVQRTMTAMAATVRNAFGEDSQSTVRELASGILTFGEVALSVAEGVYRGFRTMVGVVSLDLQSMVGAIIKSQQTTITFLAAGAAVVAKYDPTGIAKKNLEMLTALHLVGNAATHANDGMSTSLQGLRNVLGDARAHLATAAAAMAGTGNSADGATPKLRRMLETTRELTDAEKAAIKAANEQRTALERLGVVTSQQVNASLAEYAALEKRAVSEGVPLDRVLIALIPRFAELHDQAKASGVGIDATAAAMKRAHEAWERSIDPMFDSAAGVAGVLPPLAGVGDELERLNRIMRPDEWNAYHAEEAMKRLGIVSRAELARTATQAERDYSAIVSAVGRNAPEAIAAFKMMTEAQRAASGEIPSFWEGAVLPRVQDVARNIQESVGQAFASIITRADGFKDAFLGVFRSIRQGVAQILTDILNQFVGSFLKGMIGALTGKQGAFSQAFAGIFGGGGAGLGRLFGAGSALPGAAAAPSLAALLGPAPAGAAAAGAGGGILGGLGALMTNPWTIGIAAAAAGIPALISGFKKGGVINNLFGGPSQRELEGRKAAHAYMDGLTAALTGSQMNEVRELLKDPGNAEGWAKGAIALKGIYEAAGLSADAALAASDRLWKAEERGAQAVQKEIEKIERVRLLPGEIAGAMTGVFEELADSGGLVSKELRSIIDQTKNLKAVSPVIDEFITKSAENAASHLKGAVSLVSNQLQADSVAAGLLAVFTELDKRGATAVEALSAIGPAFDDLTDRLETLELSSGSAFQQIARFSTIAKDEVAGPLLTAVGDVGLSLVGLQNAGLLTQDTFMGLSSMVGQTQRKIIDLGFDGDASLRLMQPTLQTLWELHHDFGYEVDDVTSKLLDQAEGAGYVGDAFRDVSDRMTLAIEGLITKFEEFLTLMREQTPGTAEYAAKSIRDAFSRIPFLSDAAEQRLADQAIANWNANQPDVSSVPTTTVATTTDVVAASQLVGQSSSLLDRIRNSAPGFSAGTMGQFLDFGAGTLAVLHGKERVVTEAEGRREAAVRNDGGGLLLDFRGSQFEFHDVGSKNTTQLTDEMMDQFWQRITQNRNGDRTRLRNLAAQPI